MNALARRISKLEESLGCAPETAFHRYLRARLEEGLKRVREFGLEPKPVEIPYEEARVKKYRTITEILHEGRHRAALTSLAKEKSQNDRTAEDASAASHPVLGEDQRQPR
jgi:hypothetical protein